METADKTQADTLRATEHVRRLSWPHFVRHAAVTVVQRVSWGKILLFTISLFLFILAITCMKEGAAVLSPLVKEHFSINNIANSMGFGWLFAYLIMSGSPVAASALTFLDAGIIDPLSTYAMITGSRLGASLLVLIIGFIYIVRGKSRSSSLEMGLLSLTVTGSIYLVGLFIGLTILKFGILDNVQVQSGMLLNSIADLILDPILTWLKDLLPSWSLFLVGLGLIMFSFSMFDRCLPEMTLKESQLGQMSRLIYRPWVMFLLGIAVTLISMSVSVSLAILVPLSQRHFVRRENVIPYIMGANISTFIDTLFAAVLLKDPIAFTVVLTNMVSIAIVSVIVLLTMYRRYEQSMLRLSALIMHNRRNMVFFVIIILALPVFLLLI